MKLLLFNPENDLALANGDPHFVAPASARCMAFDLQSFPKWWLKGADWTIFHSEEDYQTQSFSEIMVWGWSTQVVTRLLKAGISASLLPSAVQLEQIRQLSHRRTSVRILSYLTETPLYPYAVPVIPREYASLAELEEVVEHDSRMVLKAPWSGSGKGLCWANRTVELNRQQWMRSILRRDGSVMVEPVYDKVLDFALLFYSNRGKIQFKGYSLFENDERGAYQSNLLLSNEEIRTHLAAFVPLEQLDAAQVAIQSFLEQQIACSYPGYLGIDMMIYRDEAGYQLHPCIEMNLRMTMGVVSRFLFDHWLQQGEGRFRIIYRSQPEELSAYIHQQQHIAPPSWQEGLLVDGFQLLTDVNENTCYAAVLERRHS